LIGGFMASYDFGWKNMNCLVVWNMALMTFHINHQPVKNPSSFGGGFCDSSDETLLGEPRIQRLTIRALQERPPATTPELPWGDILDVRSPLYQRYTVPWSKKNNGTDFRSILYCKSSIVYPLYGG
jgi:hypothetical protein